MFIVSFLRSALRPLFLAGLVLSAASAIAQSPSAADGFDPNVDGNVYVMATQPDGKILVAGQFATFNPSIGGGGTRNNIARLHPDGSLDQAFNPNVNGVIRALLLQPDGRIVIGGDFTAVQPNGATAATTRNRVARLNADGTVDAAFNPNIAGGTVPQVNALALQPNGKIVVGGRFTTVQPGATGTAVTRNHVARFNADGSLDTAYNPNPNSLVLALASQLSPTDFSNTGATPASGTPSGDGKIIIAGGFTSLLPGGTSTSQPVGTAGATVRNRIARLNANGTVDSDFDPNANNAVATLAIQRDGKILLGGSFTTLQPIGNDVSATRNRIARLNANGTLDSEFYPNVGGSVLSVALAPDGGVMVGGYFTSVWGRGTVTTSRSYVARINPDGSFDPAFNAGANFAVAAFAFQPDGKIVLGGYFTALQSRGLATAVSRNRLARVNSDGTVDTAFTLDAGGRPLVSVAQPDGKLLIGGSFTSVGGLTRPYLARLNANGTVDSAFTPAAPNGRVLAIARQTDGKLIIAGTFTIVGTTERNYVARLNVDGSLDTAYNPNSNGQIGAVALQADDKLLVGGNFTTFTPNGATTSTVRTYLARLNADGTVDTFDPGPSSTVSAIVVQGDGKILVGGAFSAFTPSSGSSSTSQSFIARLNADGTVDTTFTPLVNARATSLVLQSDGKIVVAGQFTLFQPPGDTTTTSTVDGVTTTVSTAISRNRLLRLNANGTIDSAYNPGAINGTVIALALQADGRVIAGGSFIGLQPNGAADWTLRKYAARLNVDGTLDNTFNLDLSEANGNRVDSLAIQRVTTGTVTEDKIIVGGNFTSLAAAGSARVAANQYVRINANGTLDASFTPGAGGASGGQISSMALQADGKIVAVGTFADIGGVRTTNVARFHAEGTADTTFSSSLDADGPVAAILHRPDTAAVATQANGLAWLNRDGSLRTAFAPAVRLTGQISVVAVQADGRILLGGSFNNPAGTTGNNLVRISADGVLDTSFSPSPNAAVAALAIQSDGKILVGGSFTDIRGTSRNRIARLNADGSLDTTFDPNAGERVNAIVVQSDGKIVIGGAFTTLQPNAATATTARNYMARLESTGAVDAGYNPAPSATVSAMLLQPDGQIVVGGAFTSFTPNGATSATARNYIARVKADGTLDTFDPAASANVNALALYPDGKIIVGGAFNTFTPNSIGDTNYRNYIARLNADGTVDANFNPNASAAVNTVAVQTSDGAVLFGGNFTAVQSNGAVEPTARNRIARANFDGSLDTAFNPDANGTIDVIAVRPDGSLIVGGALSTVRPNGVMLLGGSFATIGGVASRNLALVNDDGTVSTAFQPNPNGAVSALLSLPGGGTLIGGSFTTIAGATRNRLARFDNAGGLDTGYAPNLNGPVNAIAVQADTRALVLVGGSFTTVNGAARANLARLLPDGSTDAAFAPTVGVVRQLIIQGDGKIVVLADGSGVRSIVSRLNVDGSADGTFTAFNGGSAAINAIAVQADGRILVGGALTGFARRLNPNGSVDTTFDPQPDGAVTALTLQTDGRVLIAGSFTRVGGLLRAGLARLAATSPAAHAFAMNAARTGLTWTRGGTGTELSSVTFARSDDALTWTTLGTATRAAGSTTWTLNVTTPQPASGNFYLRARAIVASGGGTSSGLTEAIGELNAANVLASEAFRPTTAVPGVPISPGPVVVAPVPPGSVVTPPIVVVPPTPVVPRPGGAPVAGFRVLADTASLNLAIAAAQAATTPGSASAARLSNLSTRARIAAGNELLTGFAITGTGERTVLVRAVGPGLNGFGVTGTLAAPLLRLFDAAGNTLVENSGWAGAAALTQAAAASGAFPLAAGSADAALLVTLAPGAYSIQISDANGAAGGVALAEVYDVAGGTASRLANVSSRSSLTATDTALISGFVIAGTTNDNVLVRGVGPALTQFGVTGALADPMVGIYDSTGRNVAANDNWSATATTRAALIISATEVGAFAFTDGSKDAAVLLTLAPGAYTAQVTAATGQPGNALLEIYEVR
jgi:uncharacterized delta-60 repeat protein